MNPDEEELRARFKELKRRDAGRAPGFEKLWTARRPARSAWRLAVPAASIAAAAMFVLWCGARATMEEAAPRAAAPTTQAPTSLDDPRGSFDPAPLDFLLESPGASPLFSSTSSSPGRARSASVSGFDSNPLEGW